MALMKIVTTRAPAGAEVLRYVRQHMHTSIPVPRVYATAVGYKKTYLLMQKIEGDNLCLVWDGLNDQQRDSIIDELRGYLAQLRAPPSPYGKRVCPTSGGPLWDGRITCTGLIGSSEDEAGFNPHLIGQGKTLLFPDKLAVIQSRMRDDHDIRLTHGDLAPRNILVKNGRIGDIVDWGDPGRCPKHWEMVKAARFPEVGNSWDSRVQTLFSDAGRKGWLLDKEMSDQLVGVSKVLRISR